MKIYKVTMTTENPSADGTGLFISEELAKKAIRKMGKKVKENPDYYGSAYFETSSDFVFENEDNIILE